MKLICQSILRLGLAAILVSPIAASYAQPPKIHLSSANSYIAQNATDLLMRGHEKYQRDGLQGAIADFTQAIQLNPSHTTAYVIRGLARSSLGDRQGAISTPVVIAQVEATPPTFATTTREPVLLRYRFKQGERFDVAAEEATVNVMQMGSQRVRSSSLIKMDFAFTIEAITAEGNARVNGVITRVAIQDEGSPMFRYDSAVDKVSNRDEFKYLAAMLNQNVPCTITTRGELLDVNLDFINEALRRAGAPNSAEQNVDQSLQGSFIQLAEKPVSVGDIYDAGKISQRVEGIGTMTTLVRYEVLSVSADKRAVVLKPIIGVNAQIPPGSPLRIDSTKTDGWILFDLDKGNIDRSYGRVEMRMSASENNQVVTATTDITMKYVTTYRQRR